MAGAADPSFVTLFGCSSLAASIAETTTLPLDTAKVRLQLQNSVGGLDAGPPKYRGPLQTIRTMVAEEGVTSVFKGLAPGIQRQVIFSGLRIGLFDALKESPLFKPADGSEMGTGGKIGVAMVSSVIGITAANPADVIKVRFQASTPCGGPPYPSILSAYKSIIAQEGVMGGLYRGFVANLLRNSIISTTEIIMYGTSKDMLSQVIPDGVPLHLSSGLCAGFAATVLGSPMDVVGTVMMAQKPGADNAGLVGTCMNMLRTEGIKAFYRGFVPNFARIGSFNIVLWASYEQVKAFALKSNDVATQGTNAREAMASTSETQVHWQPTATVATAQDS